MAAPSLVLILGPPAVGKMTVGQELRDLTGYRLLFNHMIVDLVTQFFPFGSPSFHRLARPFTLDIIAACADEGLGLIVTHGLVFGPPGSMDMLRAMERPYRERGQAIGYVELSAPLEVRLERNTTANRAAHKDVSWATEERLRDMESWGRWQSDGELVGPHVRIDNTSLSPRVVAERIIDAFGLGVRRNGSPDSGEV